MGIVSYDGKKIVPAPFARIARRFLRKTEGGPLVGVDVDITLSGKLVAYKGSPDSNGTFWTASGYPPDESIAGDSRLGAILRKQQALRDLFGTGGKVLEIQSDDGSLPFKAAVFVDSVEFSEGPWYDVCDFTVNLKAVELTASAHYGITDANEEWSIESADEKGLTARLTHTVSAVGKYYVDPNAEPGAPTKEPWEWARAYVLSVIGLGIKPDRMSAPGVLDANAFQAFNYVRSQSLSEFSGSFSVTESWLCYAPGTEAPATEDYSVSVRQDASGKVSVTVDGSVQGLEERDTSTYAFETSRYTNALAKWTNYVQPSLLARCQSAAGTVLHPTPLNTQIGHNPLTGTISYSMELDNRPISAIGALDESISITDDNPADVFASLPVLGRTSGPVLQSINTVTARKRSLSIQITFPAATIAYTPVKPTTTALVLAYRPVGTQVFVDQDQETWDLTNGRYSRQTSWTYE